MIDGDRPNIVVLVAGNTGRHLSPYGLSSVQTPSATRLAEEGVLFENSFSCSPAAGPSRAALFTGRYPHSVGILGQTSAWTGFRLLPEAVHTARYFKDSGYETLLLDGACEIAGAGCPASYYDDAGFDLRAPKSGAIQTENLKSEMPAILDARPNGSKPFYLQISMPESDFELPKNQARPDADEELTSADGLSAMLSDAVRPLDKGLGDVLNILNERELTEKTLVVFTADHGVRMPGGKPNLYDDDLGVFLIMRYPGCFQPNRRYQTLVSNVDVLPTLLEAVGIAPSEKIEGRSVLPLLRGQNGGGRERIFAEQTFDTSYVPKRCVRTRDCKYIFNFCGQRFDELYDLANDPAEEHNLSRSFDQLYDDMGRPFGTENLTGYDGDLFKTCYYGGAKDPQWEALRQELAKELHHWMTETGDPILRGPLASPRFYDKIHWLKQHKRCVLPLE